MIISVNDGLTPYVGDNGYWFIGDEDTGVRANGQSTTTIETVVLTATGWSNLSQTVGCAGILADETRQLLTIFPDNESRDAYMLASVVCTENGANTLTFTAETAPTEDLTVYVAIEEAGQAPLETYSTEETVVGTWIDGKPLYRLTCVGVPTGLVVTLADLSSIPIDTLTKVSGGLVSRSSALPGGYATGTTSTYGEKFVNIWVGEYALKCYSPGYASGTIVASVYYTKTTDTATIPTASAVSLMNAYDEGVNEA